MLPLLSAALLLSVRVAVAVAVGVGVALAWANEQTERMMKTTVNKAAQRSAGK